MEYLKFVFKKYRVLIFTLLTYLIVIPIILLFSLNDSDSEINLNPNDYCNLTDVDYTAVLHDDPDGTAKISITEYLTYDVHAASNSNLFKELWRELPEDVVDGAPVTYKVKSVTQILEDGTEIPYTETQKMFWEDYDYQPNNVRLWHHSKGSGTYPDNDESVLFYIPWTYREKMKFKIEYDMNNAALKYNDCSELYISMYSGNTITKLNSYKAQILVPNYLMPNEDCYYAYTFGTRNDRIPFTESDSLNTGYHTFSINLNKSDLKFDYHNRYLEFCLLSYGKDKHIFTKYAPNNLYSKDNVLQECIDENEYYTNKNSLYKDIKIKIFIGAVVISLLIIYLSKKQIQKQKEKYTFYEPETHFEYFREIPSNLDPLFASRLVFLKDPFNPNINNQEEFSAILLSLARKKYITITNTDLNSTDWNEKNILISLNSIITDLIIDNTPEELTNIIEKIELEPLTTSERLYFQLLLKHSKQLQYKITLKTLQNYLDIDFVQTNIFVKNIESEPNLEIGVVQGYFQQLKYDQPKKEIISLANIDLVFGLLIFILGNIISYFTPIGLAFGGYTILGITLIIKSIYLKTKAKNLVLLTQYGENELAKWRGLYNFLNSDTLINEKDINDLPLWENYLIYATAFGISNKVIKALQIHTTYLDTENSTILNSHSFGRSMHFHSSTSSFGHSIHGSSRSFGYGGHGGYGGGGRGGGGGGGGH